MLKTSQNSSLTVSAGMRQLIVTQTKFPAKAPSNRQFSITKNRNYSTIENRKQFFLGANFPGKYFTLQEARCMFYFIQGYNYKKTAAKMKLSHRTVTYYCELMRVKMPCDSRIELIRIVKTTDFLNYLDELKKIEEESCA